jgi:hypothetical protein
MLRNQLGDPARTVAAGEYRVRQPRRSEITDGDARRTVAITTGSSYPECSPARTDDDCGVAVLVGHRPISTVRPLSSATESCPPAAVGITTERSSGAPLHNAYRISRRAGRGTRGAV